MAKPILIANVFATQTGPIPLSELDTNFSTAYAAINDYATYSNYLVDTSGVANTITVTTPANTTFGYTAGVQIQVKVANTTTSTAPQINVNGLGLQNIVNADGSAMVIAQIIAGQLCIFQYDGTAFRLLSQGGSSAITGVNALAVGPPGTLSFGTGTVNATVNYYLDNSPVFQSSVFTGNITGCTGTVNTSCAWQTTNNIATLFLGTGTGTSNTTAMTMTGLPGAITPARTQVCVVSLVNNGANIIGTVTLTASSSTITFYNGAVGVPFTAAGTKGMEFGTITYLLD
jgi:hypothetical protein